MRAVAVVLVAICATDVAAEETVMLQAGGGVLAGYDPQVAALAIDGSIGALMFDPVKDLSFGGFGRIAVVYGNTDHGYFRQLRAGFDTNWCLGKRGVCLLVGFDFGVQWFPVVDAMGAVTRHRDRMLVPRLGIESGFRSLRLYAVIDHPIYEDHDADDRDYFETRRLSLGAGFAIRFR